MTLYIIEKQERREGDIYLLLSRNGMNRYFILFSEKYPMFKNTYIFGSKGPDLTMT